MKSADLFKYIGYRFSDVYSSTYGLVISVFIMSSVVTAFTSNDIVVIALTPIIIKMCYESGIRNLKLVLLSEFVAANTMSMLTYIGSPTNIIISEEIGINFIEYSIYMILPSIVAFVVTIIIVHLFATRDIFGYSPSRDISDADTSISRVEMNRDMYIWIAIFGLFVLMVSVLTFLGQNLLWCGAPAFLFSVIYLIADDGSDAANQLWNLPYGIFFFGICFFTIGEAFVSTDFISSQLVPATQSTLSEPNISVVLGVFSTGAVVNLFNDLPAAAIVAPILEQLSFESITHKVVFIQSVLVGLNIGKYVTQVGALAAIAWFNQIRSEVDGFDETLRVPNKIDLLIFGFINFILSGVIICIFLIAEYSALRVLI